MVDEPCGLMAQATAPSGLRSSTVRALASRALSPISVRSSALHSSVPRTHSAPHRRPADPHLGQVLGPGTKLMVSEVVWTGRGGAQCACCPGPELSVPPTLSGEHTLQTMAGAHMASGQRQSKHGVAYVPPATLTSSPPWDRRDDMLTGTSPLSPAMCST